MYVIFGTDTILYVEYKAHATYSTRISASDERVWGRGEIVSLDEKLILCNIQNPSLALKVVSSKNYGGQK
jgi:hypothetical protein